MTAPAEVWPPCAGTTEYARWRDEQLPPAGYLSEAQRAEIAAAVVSDQAAEQAAS